MLPSHSDDLLYIRVSSQKSNLYYGPIIGGLDASSVIVSFLPIVYHLDIGNYTLNPVGKN
jgi:hypothetical protein